MSSQPGGDSDWDLVLAHRPPETRAQLRARFESAGVGPQQIWAALADAGDELFEAATGGADDWAKPYGGPLAVADHKIFMASNDNTDGHSNVYTATLP